MYNFAVKEELLNIKNMKQTILFSATLAAALAVTTSCSKMGALSSDNFSVTPQPLETVGGQVPATINGKFPEKYFKKNAQVTVTPVLKYSNGEATSAPASFQGEKVVGNDQTISYKVGGNYTMKANFKYVPEMQTSDLYLRFDAKKGKKKINIPEVKIGYGVISTSELLGNTLASANPATAEDKYQREIKATQEGRIKFLINQANIRNNQLTSASIKDLKKKLKAINDSTESRALDNVEVLAYASPEGPESFNDKLADKRGKVSENYMKKQLKAHKLNGNVDMKYTAEDWDGFKELVSQSNMQDKELVLRVLSMYSDPQERETQLRNMSSVFKSLATDILPELRRSRLAVNYKIIGRSDQQIQDQFKEDPSKLSNDEILYAATLTDSPAEKKAIYQKTTELYPNDYRAYNNLGKLAYESGDLATAESYYDKAASVDANAPEVNANKALDALRKGDAAAAEQFLGKATDSKTYNEVKGYLNTAKGDYAQAAQDLNGVSSNGAALAQILNKDYNGAANTLSNIKNADATTDYLKAIVAARTGNESDVMSNLKSAISKDSSYAKRAAKDLEFAKYFTSAAFQSLTK